MPHPSTIQIKNQHIRDSFDMIDKPTQKPANPCFSSGPCAKRPGWDLAALKGALIGRSHRAADGIARLNEVILRHRALLGIPDDYRLAIVPASDTGAMEMAMWGLLGPRGVDVFAWEAFGHEWLYDVTAQLKLPDVRRFTAPYGSIPDLSAAAPDRDIIFTWNGTTGGARVPDAHWIAPDRSGLTLCDATSAVFAYDLPWDRLDVTTWSWQKVLGGEAAHGMLALSPRAVERLMTYTPPWPMPKLFRLVLDGVMIDGVFAGETLNTPSMLAVEDCLDALKWVEGIGGMAAVRARVAENYRTVADWVAGCDYLDFLCADAATRSLTSVCLQITDPDFLALEESARRAFITRMTRRIADEGAGFDIAAHAKAPAGLRIWCGATVERADIAALLPWIDWAYAQEKSGG